MPSHLDTIAESVRGFAGPRDIPAKLQRRAVKLLARHTWREVYTALGISHSLLASWRLLHLSEGKQPEKPRAKRPARRGKTPAVTPRFVEFHTAAPKQEAQDYIELHLPDGTVLRAHGEASTSTLVALARSLMTRSGGPL